MAMFAPIIGAAIGGVATGFSTWGMAAGWLVGSWLFGPKAENDNKVFDPGAEEMPRFNQALRGSTMTVMFGTNRVSSNVVWQKNFTTIRKESSSSGGGGKGGGSGMGMKGGGPETSEVTYTYKWDLLFHIGMSDTDQQLYGGWLGGERLDDDAMTGILSNSDNAFAAFLSTVNRENSATLSYDEGYFHGSAATGDTIDNWAHFQTEEGGAYRWPYTTYIGFKQLNLGSHAIVPQLTWEIGGSTLDFQASGAYIRQGYPEGSGSPETNLLGESSGSIVKDAVTGDLYHVYCRNSAFPRAVYARRLSDGTDITMDSDEGSWEANYTTDWNAIMGTSFGTFPVSASGCTCVEDRYVHFIAEYPDGNFKYANALFEIRSGAFVMVGAWLCVEAGLYPAMYGSVNFIGITGAGTDDDGMMHVSKDRGGISDNLWVSWLAPSINQMKAGTVYETTNGSYDDRAVRADWTGIDRNMFSDEHGSYITRSYSDYGTYVPTFSLLPTPGYDHALLIYISKADMEWNADFGGSAALTTLRGTYPNGVMLRLPGSIDLTFTTWDRVDAIEYWNSKFVDTSGASVFPFSDSCLLADGVTEDLDNDYVTRPQCQRLRSGLGAGGFLYGFWKQSQGDYADHPSGYITRGRIFLYNPLNETFTQYINGTGSICDDAAAQIGSPQSITGGPIFYYDDEVGSANLYGTVFYDSTLNEFHVGTIGTLTIGGGEDVTPPYVIYKILTSTVYGLGISESAIDTVSYGEAVQYCEAEDIKISVQYNREEGALAIIDELLGVYGGFLIDSGGKIKFGIQEYSQTTIKTIDNDRLRITREGEAPVMITKGARQDTFNKIKVNYIDRDLEYRQNFVEISDEVDIDLNGPRSREFPPKFVMSEGTALKIATRALWGNLYARDIFDFKLGPQDADLEPGDVITLVDSYHTELQAGKQVRIVSWQESQPLNFDVRAVEEIEYVNASTLSADAVTEASSTPLFTSVKAPADFGAYELPPEFEGADARIYVGYRQLSTVMGARLFVSADNVSFAQVDDKQPYIISGIMAGGLPNREPGYFEENVEVYLMPGSGFTAATPTYAQTHALDDVAGAGRAVGASNIWINSEMMAYEGVNLVAQNHYRFDRLYRGWGGTHIQAHNSGDTWWKHGGGVFSQILNKDRIGTTIYYKVQPYNFAGQAYNIASIAAKSYQILGTHWGPQVPAPIQTYVQSPGSFLTVQSEDLGVIQKKQVLTGGSPVQFEWYQSAQEAGYGFAGYGFGTYGRFTQDTTSISYRVQVLSADLSTVVRCTVVTTTAFLYTVDANSEDWNGWQGNFAVRVTPFNDIKDALRNRVKILELFE